MNHRSPPGPVTIELSVPVNALADNVARFVMVPTAADEGLTLTSTGTPRHIEPGPSCSEPVNHRLPSGPSVIAFSWPLYEFVHDESVKAFEINVLENCGVPPAVRSSATTGPVLLVAVNHTLPLWSVAMPKTDALFIAEPSDDG